MKQDFYRCCCSFASEEVVCGIQIVTVPFEVAVDTSLLSNQRTKGRVLQ